MIENVPEPTITNTVRRYAPLSQRNRPLNRRKSGDRPERTNNSYVNDGEKIQALFSRNVPTIDHGETGSSNYVNENQYPRLIPLEECSSSEAVQLMKERWDAVMHASSDPSIESSERPVVYSGALASAWGHPRATHHQMDFLTELRRQIRNPNVSVGL
ncbi:hypothetical protein GIB67_031802 [Kingdonia uniflora]|uniref:Uncharacterized protein n=1 Tax=Kingdonia uniflora TaxID=39325 RepID=A0A7J7L4K8_9MAGN|nr:hypothetical protein GIB67_031802 [Kingdonia uniflora]